MAGERRAALGELVWCNSLRCWQLHRHAVACCMLTAGIPALQRLPPPRCLHNPAAFINLAPAAFLSALAGDPFFSAQVKDSNSKHTHTSSCFQKSPPAKGQVRGWPNVG